jgi:WD40 repeat protein
LSRWSQRHPALATGLALGFLVAAGTPTAIAIGIAAQRDRAVAAEREEQLRAYEANVAAANAALQAHEAGEARRRLDACPERLRGFEWRHLAMAVEGSIGVLAGATGPITAVALDDAADQAAAADRDGELFVWCPARDPSPRRLGRQIRDPDQLAFVDQGSKLLVVHGGHAVVVDVSRGAVSAERQPATPLERVRLVDEGRLLLAASGDWRVTSLDPVTLLPQAVYGLEQIGRPPLTEFACCRGLLFAPDVEGLRTWSLADGRGSLAPLKPGLGGDRVAAGGNAFALLSRHPLIWSGATALAIDSGAEGVLEMLIDPGGELLFGRLLDQTVCTFRVSNGSRVASMSSAGTLTAMALARKRLLLATGSVDGTVRLWSPFGGYARQDLPGNGILSALVVGGSGELYSASHAGAVIAWNPDTGEPRQRYGPFPHWVNALAVTPDGTHFYAAFHGAAELFATGAGTSIGEVRTQTRWIHAIALAPAGDLLLAATEDRGMVLVDTRAPESRRELGGHAAAALCCAFAPDGQSAYSGGHDGVVLRWPMPAGALPIELAHGNSPVRALACSGDGAVLFTAEGMALCARQAGDGALLWQHPCSSKALSLALLKDGSRLISGHEDGSLVVWEPMLGRTLLTLQLGPMDVRALVADPECRWIAAGGGSGTITILRASPRPATIPDSLAAASVKRALYHAFELHRDLPLDADVRAAIDAREDLDPQLKERIRAYGAVWTSPSWWQLAHAFDVALAPGLAAEQYRLALRIATAAAHGQDQALAATTAALAQERLGNHEVALQAAAAGLSASGPDYEAAIVELHAVRALALAACGRRTEAAVERQAMVEAMAKADRPDPPQLALRVEVEAALAR